MRRHNHNPAQPELFDFARDTGAAVIQTRARSLLIDSRPAPAPTGSAHPPAATLGALHAQAIGTHTPTAQAGDKDDTTERPTLATVHDRRPAELRIAALGGAGYLTPDDLADFAKAERAIFALMSDGAWHTDAAIIAATGGQRDALRRMRNLRKAVSTSGGVVRYAHIECRRASEKRLSLYQLSWHAQPQRHNAGQGAAHA